MKPDCFHWFNECSIYEKRDEEKRNKCSIMHKWLLLLHLFRAMHCSLESQTCLINWSISAMRSKKPIQFASLVILEECGIFYSFAAALMTLCGGVITERVSWYPGDYFKQMMLSSAGYQTVTVNLKLVGYNTWAWQLKAGFYNTWSTFKMMHQLPIFKTEMETYSITTDDQYRARISCNNIS